MKCQSRLPDTASAGQCEQTRVRERGPDCGELAAASDETCQLGWQVASRFAGGKLVPSRGTLPRAMRSRTNPSSGCPVRGEPVVPPMCDPSTGEQDLAMN